MSPDGMQVAVGTEGCVELLDSSCGSVLQHLDMGPDSSLVAHIHTYTHTHIHTYTHTHIHTHIHTHTHTHTPTCIHACMHTYTHTHTDRDRQTDQDFYTQRLNFDQRLT